MTPRPRRVIETHYVQAFDEHEQRSVRLPAAAAHLGPAADPAIELGHFTLSTDDALALAASLTLLAELADPGCIERLNEPAWDLNEITRAAADDEGFTG